MSTGEPTSMPVGDGRGGTGSGGGGPSGPPGRVGPAAPTVACDARSLSVEFGDDVDVDDDSSGRDGANHRNGAEAVGFTRGPIDLTVQLHPLSSAHADAAPSTGPVGQATERLDGGLGDIARGGGRYRVIREIGRGGMGVVYEAWDLQLERIVAIKSLKVSRDQPTLLQRFLREAQIASRLNHPGIMAVHEFGVSDDNRAFMVMRLLRGQTLRQLLDDRATPADDLPRLLAAFLQACQAVASAHAMGVIHRDLKPSNIMVGEYSLVTVMDWGLAKVLGEEDVERRRRSGTEDGGHAERTGRLRAYPSVLHTVCGTIFGTPGYLAPEQARGDTARIDRRSDVFGLGCILCEILTGSPPYQATTSADAWRHATNADTGAALDRLDACGGPEPMVQLARRCLAIDPDGRPSEAGELVDCVVAHLESGQRRAEQQLVRFFDLSVDLFCIASLSGYFRRVNDNFFRVLGYPQHTLLTRRFLDFVHPDDQETTLAEVAKLSRGETTIQFRNRYRCVDGHYVWLEWNSRAVPEEGVIYAVARDVTDRTELESALDRSRRHLSDFMDNANVPLHWVDADGIIVWANRAELELLGYSREEYVGQPIARFHADPPVIADILARLSGGESLAGYEARLLARDGSVRYVSIHSSVYAEDGVFRHTRCFSVDITALHRDPRVSQLMSERDALRVRVAALERILIGGNDA